MRTFTKTKLKLKGRQLKELQDKIAIVSYAIDHALTDSFVRKDIFELLDAARESAWDIERTLTL